MRPEPAAGAWEAPGRVCHCPGNDSRRPSSPRGPESSSPTPWRPWTLTPADAERTGTGSLCEPGEKQQALRSNGAFGFRHPVRLYLPISKCQEYLQSSGEKVLASFPVQATIHFYNDESEPDSDEEEQGEEMQTYHLQCQESEGPQEDGPGGQGRGGLVNPSRGRDGLRGGLHGKGQFPHGDSPGAMSASHPNELGLSHVGPARAASLGRCCGTPARVLETALTGHGLFHWVFRSWGLRALPLFSTLRTQLLLFLLLVVILL